MKPLCLRVCALALMPVLLAACATTNEPLISAPAKMIEPTAATALVDDLPPPPDPVYVAVYDFPDLTGQYKPGSKFAEYSKAVTQGADAILVDVLQNAGHGKWFDVVERRGLTDILKERQLIAATRQQFLGQKADPLPPLNFAGMLFEGGIVAYESNVATGGLGAKYLGIGADTQFQVDVVTINLRAVSVKTGKVLRSVTTTKRLYSTSLHGSAFKYVGLNELLELEAGVTQNQPAQLAVREAIEYAVYSLIVEGAEKGLWSFADQAKGQEVMAKFQAKQGAMM
ncbi:CsgG/HfaB family protein [Oricola nitratireducens]|uniref:CsgG/HfaB family protein n=1 Tax=Oricola nitratireducens TaxID=2775868 RepID=UPI001866030D|nr:CsgG/HfaB family protein [Oricola nitratireducens]